MDNRPGPYLDNSQADDGYSDPFVSVDDEPLIT